MKLTKHLAQLATLELIQRLRTEPQGLTTRELIGTPWFHAPTGCPTPASQWRRQPPLCWRWMPVGKPMDDTANTGVAHMQMKKMEAASE